MRITLVISQIAQGGTERVLINLAQGLLQKGHTISLVTLGQCDNRYYEIPAGVIRYDLQVNGISHGWLQAIGNNLRRLWRLRRVLLALRADVVIAFMDHTNVLTILALLGTSCPVIATEHFDPATRSCGRVWEWLRRRTYPWAARLVTVSHGADRYFSWLPNSRRQVIYNAVTPQVYKAAGDTLLPGVNHEKKWVVAMGRLTRQKGFDLLLEVWARLAGEHLDWQLIILGEGELRQELESLRDRLGLPEQAIFLGHLKEPFAYLKSAKLFVLSSRFEGFGNVLVEAMACGLPVISFDCPSGPSEIIRHGIDGLLVPPEDVVAFAQAMEQLMADANLRQRMATQALAGAARFGMDNIIHEWQKLLEDVTGGRCKK